MAVPLADHVWNRIGPARLRLPGAAVFVAVCVILVPLDGETAPVSVVAVPMLAGLAARSGRCPGPGPSGRMISPDTFP